MYHKQVSTPHLTGSSCHMQDDALQLTESLLSGAQESLKLDLSYCGITSTFIYKLNVNVGLVHSILELNLGGNPIVQEVCYLSIVLPMVYSLHVFFY